MPNKVLTDKQREKSLKKDEKRAERLAKKQAKSAIRSEKMDKKSARRTERTRAKERARLWQEKRERRRRLENKLLQIATLQKPTKGHLTLDNAALIFPASENKDKSNMFRLSVLLKENVDPVLLQHAVNDVVPRFPGITGSLKKGAFWYYIEPSYKPITVKKQEDFPCRKLGADARNALFRVLYKGKEIAVEFFHPATDGTGGVTFLNTLVKAYLIRKGVDIKSTTNAPNTLDRPRPEELEDSYQRLYDPTVPKRNVDVTAYRVKGEALPASMHLSTTGITSGKEIGEVAKRLGMTVGQLLATTIIWAVEKDREFRMDPDKRTVVVALPVNLRKLFPSVTFRNFVGQIPLTGTGSADFDAIAERVKAQMKDLITREYFTGFTTYNLKLQRNPLFKVIPRAIKTVAMKCALKLKADKVMTMSYSNLGRVEAPEEFREHVLRYDFVIGPHKKTNVSLTSICFNDVLSINVGRNIRENHIARSFFTKLSELGVRLVVESSYEVDE